MDIKVISSDLDGKELKQEKSGHFIRCNGSKDEVDIQQAVNDSIKGHSWSIGEAWSRIFRP